MQLQSTGDGSFQITFGEVLEVEYTDVNPNFKFKIRVKVLGPAQGSDSADASAVTARPLNPYSIYSPIKGEVVGLIYGPSPASTANTGYVNLYYFDLINIQSLISHNSIPKSGEITKGTGGAGAAAAAAGSISTGTPPETDNNFDENTNAVFLQPYVGDNILQSRFGQQLRFSSTQKRLGIFSKEPIWTKGQGKTGDPITVLRNSRFVGTPATSNKYIREDLEKDDSIIILTSSQTLPYKPVFKAKKAANAVGITPKYDQNQILLSSGRLILSAKQEEILAYAKKGIHLSSDKIAIDAQTKITLDSIAIHLGANAIEPLIFGQKWLTWMNNFITALGTCIVATGVGPSGPLVSNPNWPQIAQLQAQLPTLLSQISKTK